MIYVGIDYSMTSPGVCVQSDGLIHLYGCLRHQKHAFKYATSTFSVSVDIQPDYEDDVTRFRNLATFVLGVLAQFDGEMMIALEGYSYGSRSNRIFEIGENTGVLKDALYSRYGLPRKFPPGKVKKLATGQGNAGKPLMYSAFVADTGIDLLKILKYTSLKAPVTDFVDAYYLTQCLHI